jgi:MFS family permease
MSLGFYIIMAAQFFSSLADNALLVAAIALLMQTDSPTWLTPYLKFFFVISYVVLAPYVGAFADRLPKGHVMFVSNSIKIVGCALMLFEVNPLAAYAMVGLGAAAYSPAKYGILTEYLPPAKLVIANGWIEGLTVGSIILGTVLGGVLISARVSAHLLGYGAPGIDTPAQAAIALIVFVYAAAAVFNLYVPRTGVALKPLPAHPAETLRDFYNCCRRLWTDRLGQISLAVTTLFWGAGATLQFIVIEWARVALDYSLSRAAILQGVVALGIALGAVVASGHRHGAGDHRHELRRQRRHRHPAAGRHGRDGRLLRGADERAAAAPRPQPDGRRPVDRRAELQRERLDPGDDRRLLGAARRRPFHLRGDRHLRPVRRRNYDGGAVLVPEEPQGAQRRDRGAIGDRAVGEALSRRRSGDRRGFCL